MMKVLSAVAFSSLCHVTGAFSLIVVGRRQNIKETTTRFSAAVVDVAGKIEVTTHTDKDFWLSQEFEHVVDPSQIITSNEMFEKAVNREQDHDWFSHALINNVPLKKGLQIGNDKTMLSQSSFEGTIVASVVPSAPALESFRPYYAQPTVAANTFRNTKVVEWFLDPSRAWFSYNSSSDEQHDFKGRGQVEWFSQMSPTKTIVNTNTVVPNHVDATTGGNEWFTQAIKKY